MKKLFITFLTAVSFLSVTAVKAQEWVKQDIDEKVSVKFPQAPTQTGPVWEYTTIDSSSSYTANGFDLSQFGLDSSTIASQAPTQMFLDQFKGGLAQQMPNVEISKADVTTWNNFPAYNIEGELKDKNQLIFINCVFIGTTCYSFSCAMKKDLPAANKETFFSSVELTK